MAIVRAMQGSALKCVQCGAALDATSGTTAKCPYCGTEQMLPPGAAQTMRVEDLADMLRKTRETAEEMMPGFRIFRYVIMAVALLIFTVVAVVMLRMVRQF